MPLSDRTAEQDTSGLKHAVRSRSVHVVHLTHNDLDAVGADAIHRMRFGSGDVLTIWSSVGKAAALLSLVASCEGRGDLLSISDLGYHRGAETAARTAAKHGWRVEWRDHHRWQDDEVQKVRKEVSFLHIDTSSCATGIVSADIMPGDPKAAEVARVVCDYDLWKHADPRSAVLGQVLQRKKNRDYVRDCLIAGIFSDAAIEEEYAGIRAEMDAMMRRSLKHVTILDGRHRVGFAPLYGYPSETAQFIRGSRSTDIEVIIGMDGKFSIRSVDPISHLIAREFDGGGHPNAAGGSFRFSMFDRLVWFLFRRSRHCAELFRVAELH